MPTESATPAPSSPESRREKVADAYASARDKAGDAGRRAAERIEANPIAALVGGIAIGAVAGALIPASRRETEALGPVGARIGDAARIAVGAARAAGKETLDELGLSPNAARGQVDKLVDAALKTAGAAGDAAAQSFRSKQD